jgi:hypothetical protein
MQHDEWSPHYARKAGDFRVLVRSVPGTRAAARRMGYPRMAVPWTKLSARLSASPAAATPDIIGTDPESIRDTDARGARLGVSPAPGLQAALPPGDSPAPAVGKRSGMVGATPALRGTRPSARLDPLVLGGDSFRVGKCVPRRHLPALGAGCPVVAQTHAVSRPRLHHQQVWPEFH